MGLLGGMKEKLGFGDQPEWQDDGYGYEEDDQYYDDEEYVDEDLVDEPYDDDYVDDGYSTKSSSSSVRFDDYDPNSFSHVKVNSSRNLQVASYGEDTGDSYFASRISGRSPYGANIGTTASRSSYGSNVRSINDRPASTRSAAATWDAPADPAFLDTPSISASSQTGDPYSQFDSEVKQIKRDPSAHLEIIQPTKYADVEKIASAFKAGKTVALSLTITKPELSKRILDFSFGVACALNGTVDKAADKVFIISKGNSALSLDERNYLAKKGIIK